MTCKYTNMGQGHTPKVYVPLLYDFPLLNSKEPHWTQHKLTQSKGLYPRGVLKGFNKFEISKGGVKE